MSSTPYLSTAPAQSESWIASPRWDGSWLLASALLVVLPPMAHVYWKMGATGVDLLVTVLIGGPHMYATFLRTVFEPRFRERHPYMAWLPLVLVPLGVVTLAVTNFGALLSFFFFWASLHICDQASYIAQLYREKAGRPTLFDRGLDFSVAAAALYTIAISRFVDGSFVVEGHAIYFPPILKNPMVPTLFMAGAAALIAFWAVRSWAQYKRGELGRPYLGFMGLTAGVAFFVPAIDRAFALLTSLSPALFPASHIDLAVSLQGFNAWHSFQYLGLTYLALGRRESMGEVTLGFVKQMASPGRFFRFYGWNVLMTLGASVIVAILVFAARLPLEKCYYSVVLSFLLVHYAHDSVLFSAKSEAKLASA